MSRRFVAFVVASAVGLGVALLATVSLAGQAPPVAQKSWSPPNAADGHSDLQGIWTNSTLTPLERPPEFAGKEFLTEEEAAEYEKRRRAQNNGDTRSDNPDADLAIGYNDIYWERGTRVVPTRRTSLIVNPADGRVPPLTPEAQEKAAARAEARKLRPSDRPEDRSLADRCILRNAIPLLPLGYNNYLQIFQSPQHVAILVEMIHDVRIIPLDGRPHFGKSQWVGDSRGRWEGKTLVVETTNFTDKTNFRGSGERLRVVERFTRADENTLLYQFTVDDPESFTKPWSAEIPMSKAEGPVFESLVPRRQLLNGQYAQERAIRRGGREIGIRMIADGHATTLQLDRYRLVTHNGLPLRSAARLNSRSVRLCQGGPSHVHEFRSSRSSDRRRC